MRRILLLLTLPIALVLSGCHRQAVVYTQAPPAPMVAAPAPIFYPPVQSGPVVVYQSPQTVHVYRRPVYVRPVIVRPAPAYRPRVYVSRGSFGGSTRRR